MEVDLGNLVHNLNYFKSTLKGNTKIMAMVKAFAYGSGSAEIANVLQYHRVDYLGVAYADEGVHLRENNIALPIMVMNPSEESYHQLLTYNLQPEVYSLSMFTSFLQFLGHQKECAIHIKLETGMHRLGFDEKDIPELITLLDSYKNVKVASIFSHLAGADNADHDTFTQQQVDIFLRGAKAIIAAIGYAPLLHILNSPGALRHPQFQFDMIRLGIGLYGVDPTNEGFTELKPVISLKTIISQIKVIEKGETVGYNRMGKADTTKKIGVIAIGYADGFNRAFSNGIGRVLVNGKEAPIIGNVCMDMSMIDLTDVEAQEGDEVIIFGKDLPIDGVAKRINTIPYEILTNTSERVKRVFIAESI
jgi:alanine racemase